MTKQQCVKQASYYMDNVTGSFEVERFFKNCLINEGHPIDTPLQAATKASNFTRFSCVHKSGKNKHAAYKAYFDYPPSLFFQCHACATEVIRFTFKKEFSGNERKDYAKKMKEQRLKNISYERKIKEERTRALQIMFSEWSASKLCINHPYLSLKQVTVTKADGLRINSKGNLLCPIRSITGDIISLQRIYWDKVKNKFEKRFFTHLSSIGFHILGELEGCDTIYVGEGIATCLTIREASGTSVICAYGKRFDSIAKIIRKKYPRIKFIFCCDISTNLNERNTSEDNARKAKSLVGGHICLPDFSMIPNDIKPEISRSDYNDLFVLLIAKGLNKAAALGVVRQQI